MIENKYLIELDKFFSDLIDSIDENKRNLKHNNLAGPSIVSTDYSYKLNYNDGKFIAHLAGLSKDDIAIQYLPEYNEIRITNIKDPQAVENLFAFSIPDGYQFKNSEAKMENGLLEIKLAKEVAPVTKIQTLKIQ